MPVPIAPISPNASPENAGTRFVPAVPPNAPASEPSILDGADPSLKALPDAINASLKETI